MSAKKLHTLSTCACQACMWQSGVVGGVGAAGGSFGYSKHKERAAGISQRMRTVREQLASHNLASPVSKMTHVSWPSFALFGLPMSQVELSTGVPSGHWNCPCVRPLSEAETQKENNSATERQVVNFNLKSPSHSFSYWIHGLSVLLPLLPIDSKFWESPIAFLSPRTSHALRTKSPS